MLLLYFFAIQSYLQILFSSNLPLWLIYIKILHTFLIMNLWAYNSLYKLTINISKKNNYKANIARTNLFYKASSKPFSP